MFLKLLLLRLSEREESYMKDKVDLVKAWIKKAENDLITAENSIEIKPDPPLDIVCFHAQQCAEKYLKAYLVYHNIEFEKTHDLRQLVFSCSRVEKEFLEILEISKRLTDYAVDVRYPLLIEEPTIEEAREAIMMAKKIKKFVLRKLPIGEGK